jgi:hypothetical protein
MFTPASVSRPCVVIIFIQMQFCPAFRNLQVYSEATSADADPQQLIISLKAKLEIESG